MDQSCCLLDNDIQKITNSALYQRLVGRIYCLLDAATDGPVQQLLAEYEFTFCDMHTTIQHCHLERIRGIYFALLMDRLKRLLRDLQFAILMQSHQAQRLAYLRQCVDYYDEMRRSRSWSAGRRKESERDWSAVDVIAPHVALIVVALASRHHEYSHPELARFVRLYRHLGGRFVDENDGGHKI